MTPLTGAFTRQPAWVHRIESATNRPSDSRMIMIRSPVDPTLGVIMALPSDRKSLTFSFTTRGDESGRFALTAHERIATGAPRTPASASVIRIRNLRRLAREGPASGFTTVGVRWMGEA